VIILQSQLIFRTAMQLLRNSVVTRSNVAVVHFNYCLNFSSTETRIFLRNSKMGPRICRSTSLDAFAEKTPVTPVTFVDCCAELRLAENTELLVNRT